MPSPRPCSDELNDALSRRSRQDARSAVAAKSCLCVGADLRRNTRPACTAARSARLQHAGANRSSATRCSSKKPVIAARWLREAEAGATVALASDFVLMARSAQIDDLTEISISSFSGGGEPYCCRA